VVRQVQEDQQHNVGQSQECADGQKSADDAVFAGWQQEQGGGQNGENLGIPK